MSWFKQYRVKNEAYVKWVALNLPCLVSGVYEHIQSHHCLLGGYRGMGMKNDDSFVLPLNVFIHDHLHRAGAEDKFFEGWAIPNYVEIAKECYRRYQDKDFEGCKQLILSKGKDL